MPIAMPVVRLDKPIDAAKILHEARAEFAQGFSSRLSWTHYVRCSR